MLPQRQPWHSGSSDDLTNKYCGHQEREEEFSAQYGENPQELRFCSTVREISAQHEEDYKKI